MSEETIVHLITTFKYVPKINFSDTETRENAIEKLKRENEIVFRMVMSEKINRIIFTFYFYNKITNRETESQICVDRIFEKEPDENTRLL